MSKSLNEWGRFLALVLRHKPQAVGIELDAQYAYVGADCC